MKRSIDRWNKCCPEKMSRMSQAAIFFAIEDAKDDIIQLYKLAERVARLNKDAGEIGAGMLASLVEEAQQIIGESK